jgi:hypothetical protein
MLFFLIAGHALMDYALQTEPMAVCKCRRSDHPLKVAVPWFYWLTAHALLHGAAVAVITQAIGAYDWYSAVWVGVFETVAHWVIDLGKCERLYNIHVDQGLHVLCKIAWWGLLARGVV